MKNNSCCNGFWFFPSVIKILSLNIAAKRAWYFFFSFLLFLFFHSIGFSSLLWCLTLFILCSDLNLSFAGKFCAYCIASFPFIELVRCTNFFLYVHCVIARFFFDFSSARIMLILCLFSFSHSVPFSLHRRSFSKSTCVSVCVLMAQIIQKHRQQVSWKKIAWHAKCIFSIFRSNVIVKTKQNWSVIDVAWTELNKVEIFIRHDLFGYDGRHVLHYVNAMINLLQIFLLKSNTSDLHRAPYAHWQTHTLPIERFYALDGELMWLALWKSFSSTFAYFKQTSFYQLNCRNCKIIRQTMNTWLTVLFMHCSDIKRTSVPICAVNV